MDGTLTRAVIDFAEMRRRVAAVAGLDGIQGVHVYPREPAYPACLDLIIPPPARRRHPGRHRLVAGGAAGGSARSNSGD